MTALLDALLLAPGNVLPPSILRSHGYAVLATFVAINTMMYCALAVAKTLPKVHVTLRRRGGRGQRTETRSIYPDAQP